MEEDYKKSVILRLKKLLANYDDKNNKHKGDLLEYICALKYPGYKLYNDISVFYKLENDLSIYDDGIDIIDIENKKIGQVKNWKKGSYLSSNKLGTFLAYCIAMEDYKKELITREGVNLFRLNTKCFNTIRITDEEIEEYKKYANEYEFEEEIENTELRY